MQLTATRTSAWERESPTFVVAETEICPACNGSGWYALAVPPGNAAFGQPQPCMCTLRRRADRRAAQLALASNLPALQRTSFATFHATSGTAQALHCARTFASAPSGWLTLAGPYGTGKTHLAAAIANEALTAQLAVLFVVVPDLLDQLRSSYDEPVARFSERLAAVKQAELLVLDDLGTEYLTSWAREKLYQIVNYRYNAQLPTVFTTNCALDDLDGRIVSRMHDRGIGAQIVTLRARDYRRQRAAEER